MPIWYSKCFPAYHDAKLNNIMAKSEIVHCQQKKWLNNWTIAKQPTSLGNPKIQHRKLPSLNSGIIDADESKGYDTDTEQNCEI